MSVIRNVAVLNLLLATHPQLADLPLRWSVGDDIVRPEILHNHPQTREAGAALAKALKTEHEISENRSNPESPFYGHEVYGKFSGLSINFYGYEPIPDEATR